MHEPATHQHATIPPVRAIRPPTCPPALPCTCKPAHPLALACPYTSARPTTPNTPPGKTAAMKALGLAVCMAKAGLPVPANAPARLPCFTNVLADIGDEQSLTANLSTFSGHLRRIQVCAW